MFYRIYYLFIDRVTTFWKHPDFIYKRTKDYEEIKAMKQMATTMTQEVSNGAKCKQIVKQTHTFKIANSRVNDIIERIKKRDEAGCTDDDREFSSMLELIIDMVKKNPNCLTETEIADHLITFVGAVCYLLIKIIFNRVNSVFLRVKIHNRQQWRSH